MITKGKQDEVIEIIQKGGVTILDGTTVELGGIGFTGAPPNPVQSYAGRDGFTSKESNSSTTSILLLGTPFEEEITPTPLAMSEPLPRCAAW